MPDRLPAGACVVVANHSSYLDGIVLYAALPPVFGFVIKREMSKVPLANLLLRRIGAHYVDRGRGQKSARDTRKLLKQAAAGGALAFFPEGTFDHEPGLLRFRSGAFVVGRPRRLAGGAGRDPRHPPRAAGPTRLLPRPGRIEIELHAAAARAGFDCSGRCTSPTMHRPPHAGHPRSALPNRTSRQTAKLPRMIERDVMEYDVLVVGAGPAGLAAAIRLKQLDPARTVCVLEKAASSRRAHAVRRSDGAGAAGCAVAGVARADAGPVRAGARAMSFTC